MLRKSFLFLIFYFMVSSKAYSQRIKSNKESDYQVFISNLSKALASKDMLKIKKYVSSENNAMEEIKLLIKNPKDLKSFIQILRKKYDTEKNPGDWERSISYEDPRPFGEMIAIYFSYKDGKWKIIEIANGLND